MSWEAATRKIAISAIAGLFASAFALAALVFSGRLGGTGQLSDEGLLSAHMVGALAVAMFSAGFTVGSAVLGCLLLRDVARWIIRRASARRAWFMSLLRSLGDLATQIWAVAAGPMLRICKTLGEIAGAIALGGLAFAAYVFTLWLGGMAVQLSTLWINKMLDDPPALSQLPLDLSGPFALMYLGLAAFAMCLWILWRVVRVVRRV